MNNKKNDLFKNLRKLLDEIIQLNKGGVIIQELETQILLTFKGISKNLHSSFSTGEGKG